MYNDPQSPQGNQQGSGSSSNPPSGPPRYTPPPYYNPPPRNEGNGGRTVAWVFVSLITGFLLPVCACGLLIAFSLVGLGSLGSDFTGADTETGPAVGVIDLVGPLTTGDSFNASTGYFQERLDWMADNDDVEALVIRANSPGGGVNASDEMWNMLREFRDDTGKPVVVYMHGTCASGCLYVAAAADELIATRNSIIGSIGVISTFFDASELLDDIGVEITTVETADSKDFGSFYRPLTEEEREFWESQIDVVLENFIEVVANRTGSTLTTGDVSELATGRVWIGEEALNLGLVDALGYEEDALDRAADLAGMNGYRVQEYPFDFNFFNFFNAPGFEANLEELTPQQVFALPTTNDLLDSLQQPPLQYRWMGPAELPQSRR
jgi:protease IV